MHLLDSVDVSLQQNQRNQETEKRKTVLAAFQLGKRRVDSFQVVDESRSAYKERAVGNVSIQDAASRFNSRARREW